MNYYRNPKPFTVILDGQGKTSLQSKRKSLFKKMFTTRRTFWLLSIIPLTLLMAVLFGGCLMIFKLKMKCNHIRDEQAKNNEIIQNLKAIQSINQENNQLLKGIQSINGENNQDSNMIPLNYDETTQESEITQLITEEDNQPMNTTPSNDYETTTALTTNEFDEEDQSK